MSNVAYAYILSFVTAATVLIGGAAAAQERLAAQSLLGLNLERALVGDEVFSRFVAELLLLLPSLLAPPACVSSLYLMHTEMYRSMTTHRPDAAFGAPEQMLRRMRQWKRLGYSVLDSPFGKVSLLDARHKGKRSNFYGGLYEPRCGPVFKVGIKTTRDSALFKAQESALVALRHESIMPLYFTGTVGNTFFLVSELMVCSVAHILRSSPAESFEPGAWFFGAVRIFKDLVISIDHMHGRNWLHRNITPANLLINKYGRVVLADFARASHAVAVWDHEPPSSWDFSAPECHRGYWGKPSDVFSACAVLFRMMTGASPMQDFLGGQVGTPDLLQLLKDFAGESVDPRAITGLFELLEAGLSQELDKRPTASQCIALADGILEAGGESTIPLDETELATSEYVIIEHADADFACEGSAVNQAVTRPRSLARSTAAKVNKAVKKLGKFKRALRG